jgi:hypothetical protein
MLELAPTSRFHGPIALMIAIAVCALCGCGSSPPPTPVGAADVTVQALTSKSVASMKLTVQSPTALATPQRIPLLVTANHFAAVVKNLPVAGDYLFSAEAFDVNNVVFAHGMVGSVTIRKGETAKIILYVNEVKEPPPFSNSAPVIDAMTLSTTSVARGGQVQLVATAHDPDQGQTATLSFTWLSSAGCGTIVPASSQVGTDLDHPSTSSATWTAPQVNGKCEVTVTVKDIIGLANAVSVPIWVGIEATQTSTATVTISFNSAPIISGFTADPSQISATGETIGVVSVVANDPDSDALTYAWTLPTDSPCTVAFASPDQPVTGFDITGMAADATSCTFLVAVGDGTWPGTAIPRNAATAGLTLAVPAPVVVQSPPVFGIAYQSDDIVASGSVINLAAFVSDPSGGALNFSWASSLAPDPVVATPDSLGLDPAFSTVATWTAPDGTENSASAIIITLTAASSVSGFTTSYGFTLVPGNLQ